MFLLVIFNLIGLTRKETTTSIDQPVMQHSIYQSILVQKNSCIPCPLEGTWTLGVSTLVI